MIQIFFLSESEHIWDFNFWFDFIPENNSKKSIFFKITIIILILLCILSFMWLKIRIIWIPPIQTENFQILKLLLSFKFLKSIFFFKLVFHFRKISEFFWKSYPFDFYPYLHPYMLYKQWYIYMTIELNGSVIKWLHDYILTAARWQYNYISTVSCRMVMIIL